MSRSQFVVGTALGLAVTAGVLTTSAAARAITRDEVMVAARAFAHHPWTCTQANLTASCDPAYASEYVPGDYMGLPYDWGGYVSLFDFDQAIASGAGAGSYASDGELDCTVGLDCSGYVTHCWGGGHFGTITLQDISTAIAQSSLLPGDVMNKANYHVVMYSHELASGVPVFYEAIGYNVHINVTGGWSWVSGYEPRRYDGITGTTAGTPLGSPDKPIPIGSFPFSDSRNTTQSSSDVLDGCGLAPGTSESGPEYIYQVEITEPGQLTVSVSDDVGVDIDVHLTTSMNTSDCVARNDSTFTHAVDCGTYYVVADTFGSGLDQAGAYTLTVDFAPSGHSCGSGPPPYDFEGELGEPCAFPNHENLPFCNPNLGSDICIYTTGASPTSFCSNPCTTVGDCAAFPGGCCEEIDVGELYCLPASLCSSPPQDAGTTDAPTPTDAGDPDTATTPDGSAPDTGAPTPDADPPEPDGASPDGAITADVQAPGAGGFPPVGGAPSPAEPDDGGCSCRATASGSGHGGLLAAIAACALLVLRRPRRMRR